jgi:hypothetical protein
MHVNLLPLSHHLWVALKMIEIKARQIQASFSTLRRYLPKVYSKMEKLYSNAKLYDNSKQKSIHLVTNWQHCYFQDGI